MTDDQLIKYVPKIEDQIAIRQYCRREVAALEGTTATISKATESLMAKINQRRASKRIHGDDRSEKNVG
ncbi:hypothetical protein AMELA_G00037700 [Ameiurus melas]|nr:hypothetical protein AMELA_G00037700 [Ameiurus melas]